MPFSLLLMTLVWSIGWTFVIAFLFDYLAGVFADKRNFDAAYAVVALAIVPSALGTAIAPLPWIGWFISLTAGIYSLVLAYRFVPVFLELPEEARVKHFVASVVIALVVSVVLGTAMSGVMGPTMPDDFTGKQNVERHNNSGVLGQFSRQSEFVEQAAGRIFVTAGG